MRHTAPFVELGRAKAGAGTHSTCPRGRKREQACAFSGKLLPRRDAILSADRQMTQLADVAPSGPKPSRLFFSTPLPDTGSACDCRFKRNAAGRLARSARSLRRDATHTPVATENHATVAGPIPGGKSAAHPWTTAERTGSVILRGACRIGRFSDGAIFRQAVFRPLQFQTDRLPGHRKLPNVGTGQLLPIQGSLSHCPNGVPMRGRRSDQRESDGKGSAVSDFSAAHPWKTVERTYRAPAQSQFCRG
jgi:hypothetical protein